jgi:hypothetical protein
MDDRPQFIPYIQNGKQLRIRTRNGMLTGFGWNIQKGRDCYEDLYVGDKVILKWILEKYDGLI